MLLPNPDRLKALQTHAFEDGPGPYMMTCKACGVAVPESDAPASYGLANIEPCPGPAPSTEE